MRVYRVLRSSEPAEESQLSSPELVTISLAELETLRSRYEVAVQHLEAQAHSAGNHEVDQSVDDPSCQVQAAWEDLSDPRHSELAALREREATFARELEERD